MLVFNSLFWLGFPPDFVYLHHLRVIVKMTFLVAVAVGSTENMENLWQKFCEKTDSLKEISIDKQIDKINEEIETILQKI